MFIIILLCPTPYLRKSPESPIGPPSFTFLFVTTEGEALFHTAIAAERWVGRHECLAANLQTLQMMNQWWWKEKPLWLVWYTKQYVYIDMQWQAVRKGCFLTMYQDHQCRRRICVTLYVTKRYEKWKWEHFHGENSCQTLLFFLLFHFIPFGCRRTLL